MKQKYILNIRVSIRQDNAYGGNLDVSEEVTIQAEGFMEICKVLASFHELGQTLKEEAKKEKS